MSMKKKILNTLKNEVLPAMGCTEPVAVALACSKAKELLEYSSIKKVTILVSPNIYKNGLCVGIPHTDEVGLSIAGALGITGGNSAKDLRVLEGLKDDDIKNAKSLIEENLIDLGIKDTDEKVYVEVVLETDKGHTRVIIKDRHNNFIYLEANGEVILQSKVEDIVSSTNKNDLYELKIRDIIKSIEAMDSNDLGFLMDGIEMNEKIANIALEKTLGMGVGAGFNKNIKDGLIADDLANNAMMLTAAGADARMSGVSLPVMSSSGSGNNGLTAILPLAAYKRKCDVSDEKMVKALAISHIITGYIKSYIGRLSCLCGCGVAAGIGASAAISWLMNADYDQIDGAIKNMIANISGMICDGAKVGCALKLATAASTAVQCSLLAINDNIVPARNGIIAQGVEETIRNLGVLGTDGMNVTDKVILNIMKNMDTKAS